MTPPPLKRLELWWRALWIRVFTRLMRRPSAERPDWRARPHRVLFLRHDRGGDMILSTGLLRAIARAQPTVELDVLASPANAAIIERDPSVRRIVVFDRRRPLDYVRLIAALRRARYDAVIDCMVTAPSLTTSMLMAAAGAPYRIGIAGRGNDGAINVSVPGAPADAHMAVKLGRLAAAFDVDVDEIDWSPAIELDAEERATAEARWPREGSAGLRVLVNISAGTPNRRWPVDRYVQMIRRVREVAPGSPVLVMSAPADRPRAAAIAAASDGGATVADTGGFREALALVSTADLVITPDTSIVHAASAFKRPCAAFFPAGNTTEWHPYKVAKEVVFYEGDDIDALQVEPVLGAVERLLSTIARRIS